MRGRIKRLPSPALVIASIALVLAIGGGGVALAISSQKTKQIARKVANRQINKKADGLDVDHANTADEAATANSAFSAFHDGEIKIPGDLEAIGTLSIPQAGSFVIDAKLEVLNNSSSTGVLSAQCQLTAGDDTDAVTFALSPAGSSADNDIANLGLQVVHRFDSPGVAALSCVNPGTANVHAEQTKITAIEVANLTNTGF